MNDNFKQQFFAIVESLIPLYSSNPLDSFANGNVALCIIDELGSVTGRIWGNDKLTGRNFYKNAWVKASQVWITGIKTGEYETKLYNEEFSEELFGISKPDLIGWEGGQPIELKNGLKLFIGFSGFRGENDLDIVTKAITILENN